MKLTRKLESEILKTYQILWEANLSGDIKTFASFLDDKITLYGTAEGEIFTSKKNAVKFYKDTADQMTGKVEFRKRKIKCKAIGNTVAVNELCDLYVLADSAWMFYAHVRISAVFEQKRNAWKIVNWHASIPDSRTEEGDQINIDNIKAENNNLREAVRRRTEELEFKNRELEIETALERVRAIAMSMKKADDMAEICKTISQQLAILGIQEIRNVQTAIFYEKRGVYMNYEYYAKHNKTYTTETSYTNHRIHKAFANKMLKGKGQTSITHIKGKKVKEWILYQKTTNVFIDKYLNQASSLHYYWHSLGPVALGISTYAPLKKEELELFERFLKVFELSYRRYLDIEKAEAQTRESEIELALERIRARTMAMQKSQELFDVAHLLHEQFKGLGETTLQMTIGIANESEKLFDTSVTDWSGKGHSVFATYKIPFAEPSLFKKIYEGWKKKRSSIVIELKGDRLKKWVSYRNKLSGVKVSAEKPRYITAAFFSKGFIAFSKHEASSPITVQLLERFSSVFNQTYTRFLDLQKAEAQAKEARIEASLERVRSKSMAMHKSDELRTVVRTMYEQLQQLDFNTQACNIIIADKKTGDREFWVSGFAQDLYPESYKVPYINHPYVNKQLDAWKQGEQYYIIEYRGQMKKDFDKIFFTKTDFKKIPFDAKKRMMEAPSVTFSTAIFSHGCIQALGHNPLSLENAEILKRFAKVFEQTYIRFLDLQKAEAQAREAQIEAALERVRSKALAMHTSDDIMDVVLVLREQMEHLGNEKLESSNIHLYYDENQYFDVWWSNKPLDVKDRGTITGTTRVPLTTRWAREAVKKYFTNQRTYEIIATGETLKEWYEYMNVAIPEIMVKDQQGQLIIPEKLHYHFARFSGGALLMITEDKPTAVAIDLQKRAAGVFSLAYQRFLDLQKAEEQAQEARIEAALERVRSKTMAMHNSNDVGETAAVMEDELKKLGIDTIRCGIGIMHEPGDMEVWTISKNENNKTEVIIGWLDMHIHPLLKGAFESWRNKNESYSYELKDDDLLNYYNAINNYPGYPIRYKTDTLPKQIHHNEFYFPEGILFAFSLLQLTDDQRKIFKRFASVFGQTYRRYLDLRKAEAQAREAQIETALERVRSRTLAMQKSDELAETAAVLFRQLILLGIAPNRLFIILINENSSVMEAWLTDEDGSKVNKGFAGDYTKNGSLLKMYEGWKEKRTNLVIDMRGAELQEYFRYLHDDLNVPFKGGLEQKRRLQYIAYFSHGLIGMASPDEQPAETLQLLERFAYVFNLTFTRFSDLKIAEAHALQAEQDLIAIKEAKQKAEVALNELQATQRQLIQSEKMASLGELTAGIAHEIQNPLNFVNNFSELNKELIQELEEETSKEHRDSKTEAELITAIKENSEKINHHGKRAESIVKGMLEHSRKSTGIKEPTDINKLCDEFVRFSYHACLSGRQGLRAKNKDLPTGQAGFNCDYKLELDPNMPLVNVVSQDIGRVILNVVNNAFQACSEKSENVKLGSKESYKPLVILSTKFSASMHTHEAKSTGKTEASGCEIIISDNGPGIPPHIKDKIFQPFFTTKPTGQGTGLGLSLAYDIVKAHGGEIRVKTVEKEGTELIITIPTN